MSNKIKNKKVKKRYQKINRPSKIAFKQYVADYAGCGNIRVVFPSLLLNTYYNPKEQLKFEAVHDIRYNPDPQSYKEISFVVFQRSATKAQLDVIKHFKKICLGKPLIYELDDNLFDIPKWNFASEFYNKNKPYIKEILGKVTGITVSTQTLKNSLTQYNSNIKVISNHLPKFLWGNTEFRHSNGKKRICYPGSFNHFDQNSDKGDFSTNIIDFIEKTVDDYQWVFVGGIPKSLENNPKIERHGWVSVLEYPQFMKTLDIDIMIAPLEYNMFNRCKSNIKALEATALGVPLICSNIDPYSDLPGKFDTNEYFEHQIEMCMKDIDYCDAIWCEQYRVVQKQLYWEENDNLLKYVNTFLKLVGRSL